MIKLYIYRKADGRFVYSDLGVPKYVIYDISPNHDFTLTPPPMDDGVYRWVDNKWVKDAD